MTCKVLTFIMGHPLGAPEINHAIQCDGKGSDTPHSSITLHNHTVLIYETMELTIHFSQNNTSR